MVLFIYKKTENECFFLLKSSKNEIVQFLKVVNLLKIYCMPRWVFPLIISIVLIVLIEIYSFQAFKTLSKNKMIRYCFLFVSMAVYLNFIITVLTYSRSDGQTPQFQMAMGLLLTVLVPKLVLIVVLFGEDVYRWILKAISAFSSGETQPLVGRSHEYLQSVDCETFQPVVASSIWRRSRV